MTVYDISPNVELRILMDEDQVEVYFSTLNKKSKLLVMSGLEEEVFYVLGNPMPESLNPWINWQVVEKALEGEESVDLSIKWYGLKPEEVKIVEEVKYRFNLAVNSKMNLILELTSLFNPKEWTFTLSR